MGNGIVKYISYLFQCVLEVIYPGEEKCVLCGSPIESKDRLCKSCLSKVKVCESSYKINKSDLNIDCYSSAYYSNVIKELVIRLKYKRDFFAGEVLCEFMAHTVKKMGRKFDMITFVPMTKKDLKSRGFNQSEYLARGISRKFGIPSIKSLGKIRETKDQIGLDGSMRWENLVGSFKILRKDICRNRRILLIDDVFTTGATSYYCAKELINNGSGEIVILTAAKSKI